MKNLWHTTHQCGLGQQQQQKKWFVLYDFVYYANRRISFDTFISSARIAVVGQTHTHTTHWFLPFCQCWCLLVRMMITDATCVAYYYDYYYYYLRHVVRASKVTIIANSVGMEIYYMREKLMCAMHVRLHVKSIYDQQKTKITNKNPHSQIAML